MTTWIRPLRALDRSHLAVVGGKNANLGELLQHLTALGVRVPDGFALTADAFRRHLRDAGLEDEIYGALGRLDVRDVAALARTARAIRERIRGAPLPADVVDELRAAYDELSRQYGEASTDVAIRSSATAEDLPEASFAGQQESYLNIRGHVALIEAVRDCMASLFTDRAIVYRAERGYSHRAVALSVGVQKMVRSDLACAGVIFTLDTESGFRDVVHLTGAWGLGETVVKGQVNPDEIAIHKPTLALGFRSIVRRDAGDKAVKLVYDEGGRGTTKLQRVPAADRKRLVVTDDEALELARWAVAIEAHYGAPMDIEWAKDGRSNELFVVQARPETVHARTKTAALELYRLKGRAKPRLVGKSVGSKIGVGRVRVVHDTAGLESFVDGEVLVASMTDPDWEPVLARAAAVVTDQGGRTCHAAIVSRELGIPCVVGTGVATSQLANGDMVTVSCAEGSEGHVYDGALPFVCDVIDPSTLPSPRVPVMLNVGNPDSAFALGMLPAAGVGLARIEFIISAHIGIHPMALVHPERVEDRGALAAIRERLGGAEPREYFVEKLATGIGRIAAAFYPRPVIVRFSDFKTNEYASLLGGAAFEPVEANPMIGFRGASRYYDARYREGFALECAAIARVRERLGMTNVTVMIPFCRTLGEARAVEREMAANGLVRGAGFEVYVMCEIPNNVVLAAEFAQLFDGFSIGSNDLTQLTLGVDRDSELLAHLFDEQDPGVKALIAQVVRVAHEHGRKVGLCGQAPSDHPEFAAFLASIGIDSISVTPDALPAVLRTLAE